MRFVRDLYNLPADHPGCVATIGNFDGVHRGHRLILDQLKACAEQYGLPSVVISFEPHPQEFFLAAAAPARLMRLREKIRYLRQLDIDMMLCLHFNRRLADQSAKEFVRRTLVENLSVRHLIVGADFRFGHQRRGDLETLRLLGRKNGFTVVCAETCEVAGSRVSSSRVRSLLEAGELERAEELLGHPYSICGRVVHGDKRGRELGFATININMHRLKSPVNGIFASRVHGIETHALPAVSSVGSRPVFNGRDVNLETHILDFSGDVYGARVEVELCKQLRKERNFDSVDALKKQMAIDVDEAREFFAVHKN